MKDRQCPINSLAVCARARCMRTASTPASVCCSKGSKQTEGFCSTDLTSGLISIPYTSSSCNSFSFCIDNRSMSMFRLVPLLAAGLMSCFRVKDQRPGTCMHSYCQSGIEPICHHFVGPFPICNSEYIMLCLYFFD